MSALLFIRQKRKTLERIDLVGTLRMAMHGEGKAVDRLIERWAREAEIRLTSEE